MITIRNILVPTDFGRAATAALTYARDLARQYGAALHVMYVADDMTLRFVLDSTPMFLPQVQKELEEEGRTRLAALLSLEDRARLGARAFVCTSISPSSAIVDYARQHEIDLIVMGTHGRGAVSHMLMGSVAERVVRTSPCPVLTMRDPHGDAVEDALAVPVRARVASAG